MLHKLNRNSTILLFLLFTIHCGSAADISIDPTGNNDQKAVSDAIKAVSESGGGTVYLNAGVYDIANTVTMKSNVKLTGDKNAIFRVSASYQWFTGQIGVISNPAESLQNVEICNFQIDGNIATLPREWDSTAGHDRDCEKLILIGGWSSNMGSNIIIHDMKLYDAFSDGVYVRFTDGVYIYNNFISDCQHEGFYLSSCRNGLIYNNSVAGITSDAGRLDNCQHFLINYNTFFSYDGPSYGAYKHGENGLQIGDQSGSSHGYTPTEKPFTTQDIEVTNNTFADPGLRAIWLSGGENVYVHDNHFKDASALETKGIPIGNVSFVNPPSVEMSEKVFENIFDILDTNLTNSGITNQTDDSIQYSIQKTTIGNIAGGVKIIGFRNQIVIDNTTYMPDNNSTIVKSDVVLAPGLNFWNQGVDKINKDINVKVKNRTATVTMTVNMKVYSVSYNQATKKTTKTYKSYTATFNDTAKAPDVFPSPQDIQGRIEVYPTFFEVFVPSDGLVKIDYAYGDNVSTHQFLRGERKVKDNVQYTEYSRLEDWLGDMNHTEQWCFVYGTFDESKLNVKASTPYQDINVTNFVIKRHDYPKDPIAFWLYPTIGFLICLYFIGRFFWHRIWF